MPRRLLLPRRHVHQSGDGLAAGALADASSLRVRDNAGQCTPLTRMARQLPAAAVSQESGCLSPTGK